MTCPKCNFQNPKEVKICQNCKASLSRKKNMWKIGFFVESILLSLVFGSWFMRIIKTYPEKSLSPSMFLSTSSPTQFQQLLTVSDEQNLSTDQNLDTSAWKKFEKTVDGVKVSFKYPDEYKVDHIGSGDRPILENSVVKPLKTIDHPEFAALLRFGINDLIFNRFKKSSYSGEGLNVWINHNMMGNFVDNLNKVKSINKIKLKNKEIFEVTFVDDWMLDPQQGQMNRLYIGESNNFVFYFVNYFEMPFNEFIEIIDSFEVEKCLKFCRSN